MRRFRIKTLAALIAIAATALSGIASAATELEKRTAIDTGLAYLAANNSTYACGALTCTKWVYSGGVEDAASTGSALLAFLEEKPNWGANAGAYQTLVNQGLNYLFGQAASYNISNEPAGNPDTNGNGIGVKFVPGGNNQRDTYVTGLVLPVIAKIAADTPAAIVPTGSQAGRTYAQVVQDVVDYFAYGQADSGNTARGGWRYYADYGQSDNSTAQWPPLGMLYAQKVPGVSVPAFVKSELTHWIDYIQCSNGGSGYNAPCGGDVAVSEAKTGGLLVEMAFAGYFGTAAGADKSNLAGALAFLNASWKNMASGTWFGNFDHPYAMWSIYKGLETTIGLDNTTAITNLMGCGPLDPGDVCNWWQDYSEWIVRNQRVDGGWLGYSNWPAVLATPWFINILAATEIPGPSIPEPGTLALAGLAIAGLAAVRRRRSA